mmetsp:Transcript_45415/g.131080  ORF Transcript_45415/g.131080 Transcript_45415/m.131080 type:complete len:136 (+) Transcript_45415:151-558(+)
MANHSEESVHNAASRPADDDDTFGLGDGEEQDRLDHLVVYGVLASSLMVVVLAIFHCLGMVDPEPSGDHSSAAAAGDGCPAGWIYCASSVHQDLRCLASFVLGLGMAYLVGNNSKGGMEVGSFTAKRLSAVSGLL